MDLYIQFWSELAEFGKKHPIFWRKHEQELLYLLIAQGFPYSSYEINSKMTKYLHWQRQMV